MLRLTRNLHWQKETESNGFMEERTASSQKITAGDCILIIIFLVLGSLGLLAVKKLSKPGGYVCIYQDSVLVERLSLAQDGSYTYDTAYGRNQVEIRDGAVSVTQADCPDLLCVKQGSIKKDRETIICLPHKFVVEVQSED